MIGISLHVHDGRGDVLGLVPEGVDDDAARDGAVRAGAPRFGGPGDLELAHFRPGFFEIEAQGHTPPDGGGLEESPTLHEPPWLEFIVP